MSTDTVPAIVSTSPDDLKKAWNDQLEAIQFTTRVFAALTQVHGKIDSDFILAKLEPKQREYIINNVKLGILTRRLIPAADVGDRIFDTIITEAFMIAVLHRNIDRNTLLEIIGGVRKEQLDQDLMPQESLFTKLTKKLGGKKNKEEEE